ncbi:MAG: LacI family DNA-binding transcriptional regulator [Streptomyces sp.]|nr:LacI family DNA-binding transcriptional regulator [Streptomyces sp.]
MSRPLPAHGTLSRYKYHRCRCLTCCDGWRDYSRNTRRQQAYGRWEPLVDPAPVRAHVEALQAAGLGLHRIAELAGVAQSTVSRLLYGKNGRPPQQKMQRAKAERILAVQVCPDAHANGAMIDATGSRRRIQALVALGWTHRALAPHIGVHPMYVGDFTTNTLVTAVHARTVAAVYNQLWNKDPLQHGVTKGGAKRSRNLAARRGWPPPLAWDDETIDDPTAEPASPAAETELNRDELAALRRDEISHLAGYGLPPEEIAARLSVGVSTVTGILREQRTAA